MLWLIDVVNVNDYVGFVRFRVFFSGDFFFFYYLCGLVVIGGG